MMEYSSNDMCGANGTHVKCGSMKEVEDYICRDCGGSGPLLVERIRPRIINDSAISNSSLDTSTSSVDSLSELLESSCSDLEKTDLDQTGDDFPIISNHSVDSISGPSQPSKPDFFARKMEMIALLQDIAMKEQMRTAELESEIIKQHINMDDEKDSNMDDEKDSNMDDERDSNMDDEKDSNMDVEKDVSENVAPLQEYGILSPKTVF